MCLQQINHFLTKAKAKLFCINEEQVVERMLRKEIYLRFIRTFLILTAIRITVI